MDKPTLLAAIESSGWESVSKEDFEGLLSKLTFLEKTGRYGKLLASIESSNDSSNFFACVLEATFAYQFEAAGKPLEYEVQQGEKSETTIDFARRLPSGDTVYFEVRLLQQDKQTAESIKEQLKERGVYSVAKDGEGEMNEIIRLQRVILSKVQKADGTPVKFSEARPGAANIVVVDISEIILKHADIGDCLLTAYGDVAVRAVYRRGIFGLFQQAAKEDSEHFQGLAKLHRHIRDTVHGVLFVFKDAHAGVLDYRLEHYLTWNSQLGSAEQAEAVYDDIAPAIPLRREHE